jgi:hypothetical protein
MMIKLTVLLTTLILLTSCITFPNQSVSDEGVNVSVTQQFSIPVGAELQALLSKTGVAGIVAKKLHFSGAIGAVVRLVIGGLAEAPGEGLTEGVQEITSQLAEEKAKSAVERRVQAIKPTRNTSKRLSLTLTPCLPALPLKSARPKSSKTSRRAS